MAPQCTYCHVGRAKAIILHPFLPKMLRLALDSIEREKAEQ